MDGCRRFGLDLHPFAVRVRGDGHELGAGLQFLVGFRQVANQPRARRDFQKGFGCGQLLRPLPTLLDERFELRAGKYLEMQQRASRLRGQQLRVRITQIVAQVPDHIAGFHRIRLFQHDDRIERLGIHDRVQFLLVHVPIRRVRRHRLADDRACRRAGLDRLDFRPAGLGLRLLVRVRDDQFRPARQDADDLAVRQIADANTRNGRRERRRFFRGFVLGRQFEVVPNEVPEHVAIDGVAQRRHRHLRQRDFLLVVRVVADAVVSVAFPIRHRSKARLRALGRTGFGLFGRQLIAVPVHHVHVQTEERQRFVLAGWCRARRWSRRRRCWRCG
ncbi:hypothetical protein BDO18943_04507 [Burkholderia dolosa]|nr:hypothetical protein BDO18943_04507 [Burkholderia dolosa]